MDFQLFHPIIDYTAPLVLLVAFVLMYVERRWALRRWVQGFFRHLLVNAGTAVPTFIVLRLGLIPLVVATAHWARQHEFGLLHWVALPAWLAAIVAFLLLDYLLYAWHWLSHRVPLLWRFHNVHHTDLDLGVTTGIRFHFGEMILSALFRAAGVALIGAAPTVVLVYEVIFELSVAFHHSNWRLPLRLERLLNLVIVTPRMHGIHHSVVRRETDSNYSNLLNLWDRLHRTLRLNVPQDQITVGIPGYHDAHELSVFALLLMPFRKQREYWRGPDGRQPERVHVPPENRLPPDSAG